MWEGKWQMHKSNKFCLGKHWNTVLSKTVEQASPKSEGNSHWWHPVWPNDCKDIKTGPSDRRYHTTTSDGIFRYSCSGKSLLEWVMCWLFLKRSDFHTFQDDRKCIVSSWDTEVLERGKEVRRRVVSLSNHGGNWLLPGQEVWFVLGALFHRAGVFCIHGLRHGPTT